MIGRRFVLKITLVSMFLMITALFSIMPGRAVAQVVDIRVSSQSTTEKARLKRCKDDARKYKDAVKKAKDLKQQRAKIRKQRADAYEDYKFWRDGADEAQKAVMQDKMYIAHPKLNAKRVASGIKDAKILLKEDSKTLVFRDAKASKSARKLAKLKAKEAKLDSQIKKQNRLRGKYKKLLAKDKCGKIKRDKVKTYVEFGGGD